MVSEQVYLGSRCMSQRFSWDSPLPISLNWEIDSARGEPSSRLGCHFVPAPRRPARMTLRLTLF
jgi:hypothetical protein